jgi:hypothetical protein
MDMCPCELWGKVEHLKLLNPPPDFPFFNNTPNKGFMFLLSKETHEDLVSMVNFLVLICKILL